MLHMWHIYECTFSVYAYQILTYMAYVHLGHTVSDTYLAIASEVEAAFGYALACLCTSVWSTCTFSMLAL